MGAQKMPFTSRSAWLAIQAECSDLRCMGAHLCQGTRPSKKLTKVRDAERYLNVATVSRDDLLVVRRHTPLAASTALWCLELLWMASSLPSIFSLTIRPPTS